MKRRPVLKKSALRKFVAAYDTSHEDIASESRGAFLKAFPQRCVAKLTVDDYVIGLNAPTFCNQVEAKTRQWGIIQGATAFKFGIYFGRTRSEAQKKYRFSHKFGRTKAEAFRSVKKALLHLVNEGSRKHPDFAAIDANPLSQMFKAKILSLYFPDRFLNVCSGDHLRLLSSRLGLDQGLCLSEYQNLLLQVKLEHPVAAKWSNPKFMRFLYSEFIRTKNTTSNAVDRPGARHYRKMNFEEIQRQRDEIGRKAESFALEWEKKRLIGIELSHLCGRIVDRRDQPGFGYDFLSHTREGQPRYIEAKSVAKLRDGHRFFLSENEHATSRSKEHSSAYYFYLVTFDGDGEPLDVMPLRAPQLYAKAEIVPSSFTVRFKTKPKKREK